MIKNDNKDFNVIFIIIDDLRAKNLGYHGYSKNTSPNVDNFMKESIFFEQAYSTIPNTDPSLTTIFSGKYPSSHGIINHGLKVTSQEIRCFNESDTILLPEILKNAGYTTLAVDWMGRWHKKGYDFYSGTLGKSKIKFAVWKLADCLPEFVSKIIRKMYQLIKLKTKIKIRDNATEVTNTTIELIDKHIDQKFFVFAHYWDTHLPYYAPKRFIKMFLDNGGESISEILPKINNKKWRAYLQYAAGKAKTTKEVIGQYDASIRYVDYEIGRLLNNLKEKKLLENTIIIITSDHGESLTEHGIYFAHHGLYDETLHVPLLIKHPMIKKQIQINSLVQHVDIVPTILDLLNIKRTDIEFDGNSLLPIIKGEKNKIRDWIYSEEYFVQKKKAIRTKEYKYIYSSSSEDAFCEYCGKIHGGITELYDLRKDPAENHNLAESKRELRNIFHEILNKMMIKKQYHSEKRIIHDQIKKIKKQI